VDANEVVVDRDKWRSGHAKAGRVRMSERAKSKPLPISETDKLPQSPADIAAAEGYFWGDEVSEVYFKAAERSLDVHWTNIIAPVLDGIEYSTVLDLASGHGRNAQRLAEKAKLLYCVDINPENIVFLKRRFAGDQRFVIVRNDGATLSFFEDTSIDLLYCFDALVHFDIEIVQSYLKEGYRILRTDGHAFIHCSNYTGNPGGHFSHNPHWRNFMSFELFSHLAIKAGFAIAAGRKISWGDIPDLDCVFLLRKD
jgi:ubiquinone/menaquinone biosynthesis C-methylase UbiE